MRSAILFIIILIVILIFQWTSGVRVRVRVRLRTSRNALIQWQWGLGVGTGAQCAQNIRGGSLTLSPLRREKVFAAPCSLTYGLPRNRGQPLTCVRVTTSARPPGQIDVHDHEQSHEYGEFIKR